MPPHFFREVLMLNSDVYVELLITAAKPWITRAANGRSHVWPQDYDYTSSNVWPPNYPNLNPMDYYVWGAVEKSPIAVPVLQKHRQSTEIRQFLRPIQGKVFY